VHSDPEARPAGPALRRHAALYAESLGRQLKAVRELVDLLGGPDGDGGHAGLALTAVADRALAVGEAHIRASELLMSLVSEQAAAEPADDEPIAAAGPEVRAVRLVRLPPVDVVESPYAADPVALVVEHGPGTAAQLAGRLEERGWTVRRLTLPEETGEDPADPAAWDGSTIEQRLAEEVGRLPRLDLCLSVLSDRGDWPANIRQLSATILLAKHAHTLLGKTAADGARAGFAVLTRLDGRLGLLGSAPLSAALLGGAAGTVKTLAREAPRLHCRALDVAPGLDAGAVADTVLDELHDAAADTLEVGIDAEHRRWSVTPGPHGASPAVPISAPDEAVGGPVHNLGPDDVVLVTGGARGVTALCVRALAETVACELLLLGRTALSEEPRWAADVPDDGLKAAVITHWDQDTTQPRTPRRVEARYRSLLAQREVRATLAAVTATGAKVTYIAADIADPVAVRSALAADACRVTALVHGAGALADGLIVNKTPQALRTVFAPKLLGLRHVLDTLADAPLRHLVLFTSVAGLMGNPGQSDYAAANEALCRIAAARKHRDLREHAVAVDWGAWDAGMVTPEVRELFAARGVRLLAPDEGARAFTGLFDAERAERARVLVGPAEAPAQSAVPAQRGAFAARRGLSGLGADPVIAAHRIGAACVLPATFGLGWMVNAAERAFPGLRVVEARDVQVRKGIVFDGAQRGGFWAEIVPAGEADGRPSVSACIRGPRTRLPVSHYAATLLLGTGAEPPPALTGLPLRRLGHGVEDALEVYRDATLFHGPALQGLRRILDASDTRLVLECRLPDSRVGEGAFAGREYSPVLSDILLHGPTVLATRLLGHACLPLSIGSAEFFAPLPDDRPFVTVVDDVRPGTVDATMTATACDAEGRVLQRFVDVCVVATPGMSAKFAEAVDARREAGTP
jgi:NADP-dependent 3-hydroxy acid dehydrogenase YdfG